MVFIFVCGPITVPNDACNAVAINIPHTLKGFKSSATYLHPKHFSAYELILTYIVEPQFN
jgi:hypothetical protein